MRPGRGFCKECGGGIVCPAYAYIYHMDRIIYFYVMRGQGENLPVCKTYLYRRRGYELVRAGLAPEFVRQWEAAEKLPEEAVTEERGNFWAKVLEAAVRIRQKKRQKQKEEAERLFWRQQFQTVTGELAACLERGKERTEEYYFSCEASLLQLLLPEKNGGTAGTAGQIWRQSFGVPLFENYLEVRWVEHLLQRAVLPHFLILGYYRELPEILCRYAVRMKSLKWILPERMYSEGLQEFLEDFYEEYGIAVSVQLLQEGEGYGRARICCREPSNILDFSGEERIPLEGIAKESIWLDMISSEEKCRRVEGRNTGIHYFSLKKEWKQPVLP